MKNWWMIALGVIFGLLGAGIVFLSSQPPRGNAIALLPPPTPIPIQVHITGAVINPGVYALPPGSRVLHVIEAAGGLAPQANSTDLNLVAFLEDGLQVQVPSQIPTATPPPVSASNPMTAQNPVEPAPAPGSVSSALIDINTASQSELESLSGIGPVTALKIIAFREENGPFSMIEEIQKVSGIGPATFEKIKDFITVGEEP